jgi:hypothetical protein
MIGHSSRENESDFDIDFFSVGTNHMQHWCWSTAEGTHVLQHYPTRLNRAFFKVPLSNRQGKSLASLNLISSLPAYSCINVPHQMRANQPAHEGDGRQPRLTDVEPWAIELATIELRASNTSVAA